MSARVRRNPLADALDSGVTRRRKTGESVSGGRSTRQAMERRVAVDVPSDLYTEAKVFAAREGVTVKEIMVAGLRAELERLTQPASE